MKEYIFKVKIVDKRTGLDKMEFVTRWRDKGQPIAKDLLRLSVQDDFKNTHGHWPESVELECLNPDIGVIPKECFEEEK